jgi:serine/threonine protein kinase
MSKYKQEPETEHKTEMKKSDSKEALYSFFPDKTKIPVTDKLKEFCRDEILIEDNWSQQCSGKHRIAGAYHHTIYFKPYPDHKITLKVPTQSGLEKSWKVIEYEAIMHNYARQASPGRVVYLRNVFKSTDDYSLCFEYIPSLESLMMGEGRKPLSWRTRLTIALEVATALKELHAHKIFHGQIRSHHVLFDEKTKEVKLTDFSVAILENDEENFRTLRCERNAVKRWSAPEELHGGNSANSATDIYGFGHLLYEMATGFQLFSNVWKERELGNLILAGKTSEIPRECPLMIKELIQSCWSLDPNNRPTAAELVERLKHLISSLPRDICTIDQEADALNYKFTPECRLAFFSGFNQRLGENSPLRTTLSPDDLYDKHLLPMIFEYLS